MNYGVTEQEFDSALHKLKKMAAAGKTTGEELATLGDMIFYGYSQEESNAEQAMPYWEMALAKGYAIETEKKERILKSYFSLRKFTSARNVVENGKDI